MYFLLSRLYYNAYYNHGSHHLRVTENSRSIVTPFDRTIRHIQSGPNDVPENYEAARTSFSRKPATHETKIFILLQLIPHLRLVYQLF